MFAIIENIFLTKVGNEFDLQLHESRNMEKTENKNDLIQEWLEVMNALILL